MARKRRILQLINAAVFDLQMWFAENGQEKHCKMENRCLIKSETNSETNRVEKQNKNRVAFMTLCLN